MMSLVSWLVSFVWRREQAKARPPKETEKPRLEVLEDRTVPSASPLNAFAVESVTSPPAALYAAALTSYMVAEVGHEIQVIDTIEQDVLSDLKTLAQDIYQEVAALEQKWLNLFSIRFTASNQAPNDFVMPPVNNVSGIGKGSSSGSGSGSGATTTHHESDQPIHSFAAQPGSGAGNGSSPDSSGGSATVYGNVFLDNNGDGIIDNGESGFVGDGVVLYTQSGSPVANTTTDANGNYSITINAAPPPGNQYYIAVGIPNLDYATIPGYSQINAYGDSALFSLYAGAPPVQINAGIRSMNVTTLADDPGGAIPMQITLRDAMETGNNGPPTTAVTFNADLNGGTISLQAELPPIAANYNILGPTANPITVNGNELGTIFTVNATSEIDNLVIENGEAADGGDILDNGNLTLNADTVEDGDADGSGGLSSSGMSAGGPVPNYGGGLYILPGKAANILGGIYQYDKAEKGGGGIVNFGDLHFGARTSIVNNTAGGSGGGIYNAKGGTVSFTGTTTISNNTATASTGGGVWNSGTFTMTGGVISKNSASTRGGGVNNSTGTMTLSQVSITGNSAGTGGGGLYVNAGTVTLKQDFIRPAGTAKNQAPSGGGMFIQGGTVKITGGSIASNTASRPAKPGTTNGNGGGIYNYMGSLTIKSGVKITNNAAHNQGGGMYLLIGSTTTFNPAALACTFNGNKALSNQGVGAYQQWNPPNKAMINTWFPWANVIDNDDTKENNPGRTGLAFRGP